MSDTLPIVAFAEIPQTDLVEIVQTDRLGNAVYEDCVGDGCRNDIGEFDLEEVGTPDDRIVVDVAYKHENEEDRG